MAEKKEQNTPECIGIIMDGNRRWARDQGLEPREGHRAGYEKMKEAIDWAQESGVKTLIVYALSTENWKRSKEEIDALMNLMRFMVSHDKDDLNKKNICIKFRGQRERLPDDLQKHIADTEKETKDNTGMTFVILISYGGRTEIVEAAKRAVSDKKINEETFKKYMWLSDVSDPDLVVRTGGERRLSNFLLWHIAYSELYFTDVFWPAFTKKDFQDVLSEYASRKRRYGK